MSNISKLIGGAFLIASISTMPAFSQTTENMPMPQQEQQKIDVTDAELGKFVDSYKQMQVMGQQAQEKMVSTVEGEGLEIARFNEIHQATMDPEAESDATPEEMEKHKAVIAKLDVMQEDFQNQMAKIVENQDLSMERYEQIAMALQGDTELQQRMQKLMM